MEIKKEILPKSKVKLEIKISSFEMQNFFRRVYDQFAQSVEVKGFRKNTAPRSLVINAVGENKMQAEIIDLALRETYPQAIKKENLTPVSAPKVQIKMLKDIITETAELTYEAEVDVMPEVKLGDYKKIKAQKTKKEIKATAEEIDQVLNHLAEQKAEFLEISRPLKEGDRAEINFEGSERGVVLENLTSKNYPVILGKKVLIAEFEKHLLGLKKGDKKEFQIIMKPSDNQQSDQSANRGSADSGKKIDFKVEVLQTQEVISPKLDDAFAKNYQKNTVSELKKAIGEDIEKQKEIQEKNILENDIIEKLLKITDAEISEGLISQETDRLVSDFQSRTSMAGITFEKYLENIKKTADDFRKDLEPQAEKNIKIGLALGEVAKKEGFDLKDKDAGSKALDKLIEYSTK